MPSARENKADQAMSTVYSARLVDPKEGPFRLGPYFRLSDCYNQASRAQGKGAKLEGFDRADVKWEPIESEPKPVVSEYRCTVCGATLAECSKRGLFSTCCQACEDQDRRTHPKR